MKEDINNETLTGIIERLYQVKNKGYNVEITQPKRSTLQNSALHLYFTIISTELTNLGITFNYSGIKGQNYEMPYTSEIVKNFIWKPIQIALFDFESTTKLTTNNINTIVDVITKFFAEKGIQIIFPSIASFMLKETVKNAKQHI